MATKQTNRFEIIPSTTISTDLSVFSSGTSLSRREVKKVGAEAERQNLAIRGQQVKAEIAADAIGAIREHSTAVYAVATTHMQAINQQVSGKPHEGLVNDFVDRQSEALGNNLLGVAEIAGRNIAGEVARSLYQQAEEQKHWWQK